MHPITKSSTRFDCHLSVLFGYHSSQRSTAGTKSSFLFAKNCFYLQTLLKVYDCEVSPSYFNCSFQLYSGQNFVSAHDTIIQNKNACYQDQPTCVSCTTLHIHYSIKVANVNVTQISVGRLGSTVLSKRPCAAYGHMSSRVGNIVFPPLVIFTTCIILAE